MQMASFLMACTGTVITKRYRATELFELGKNFKWGMRESLRTWLLKQWSRGEVMISLKGIEAEKLNNLTARALLR